MGAPSLQADLVLEGGGVKGIGLIGAISVLEEAGYTFRRVAGTSAGSIIGAFVAAGMTTADMRSIMEELDYRRFRDEVGVRRVPLLGEPLALWFHHGIYAGNYMRDFIAGHLADHGVRTFGDLRDDDAESSAAPDERFKLVVHVSDVSRSRLLRLPWDYQPAFGIDPDEQLVADAVRASASIPFFFRPIKLRPATGDPSWLVDGGMMSNFPVDVFDRTDGRPPRWETIGIRLSAESPSGAVVNEVRNLRSLTEAMFHTMMSWYDLTHINAPSVIARTVFVDTTGYRATDFSITKADQQRLYESGRAGAEKWLAGRGSR